MIPQPSGVAHPPLPVGADTHPELVDDWQPNDDGQPDYRCCWTPALTLTPKLDKLDVRGVVTQLADGTIITEGDDQPHIYLYGDNFTRDEVRALANALMATADILDIWAGVGDTKTSVLSRLEAIKDDTSTAVRLLRIYAAITAASSKTAGEAAAYLQTANDSASDAAEVLR